MFDLIAILVLGTSIWVFFDARAIGIKKGQMEGMLDLSPWGWAFCCLLLWIVCFPLYLSKRDNYKQINSHNSSQQNINDKDDQKFITCEKCGSRMPSTYNKCYKCGSPMKNAKKTGYLPYLTAVAIVLIVLLGYRAFVTPNNSPTHSTTKSRAGLTIPSLGHQIVTFNEFNRIKTGISYRETVNIIGTQGEEISRNMINGVPGVTESIETIMFQWINKNGSNMNAMFQNDKLVSKAQFGLK